VSAGCKLVSRALTCRSEAVGCSSGTLQAGRGVGAACARRFLLRFIAIRRPDGIRQLQWATGWRAWLAAVRFSRAGRLLGAPGRKRDRCQRCGGVSRGGNPSAFLAVAAAEGGRPANRHAEFRHFAMDPAVSPQRILLRQTDDKAGGAPDCRRAARRAACWCRTSSRPACGACGVP